MNENSIPSLVIQNDTLGTLLDGVFSPLNGIMLHFKPDLDAVSAPTLLTHLGIAFGGIVFRSTGDDGFIEGHSAEKWLKSGWLPIDVGGGIMDHHPSEKNPGICATSLMWKFILSQIEVEDELRSRIQKFVNFVTVRDTKGNKQNMDLAHICDLIGNDLPEQDCYLYMRNIIISYLDNNEGNNSDQFIKIFSELRADHPELKKLPPLMKKYLQKVMDDKHDNTPNVLSLSSDEMRDILEVWLIDQKSFYDAKELLKKATIFNLDNGKFGLFRETDNVYFLKVALNYGASLVIIKNSSGNKHVFSQRRDKIPTAAIAGLLRYEERLLANDVMPKDLTTLCEVGYANSVWYLTHGMILNGSNSNPYMPATRVKDKKAIQACRVVCSDYMPACKRGEWKCIGKNCKIHFIGGHLERCIKNGWMQ